MNQNQTPTRQQKGVGLLIKSFNMEQTRKWDNEVEEILKLVDSGAFHSVYDPDLKH